MRTKAIILLIFSSLLSFSQSYDTQKLAIDSVVIHATPNPFFTTCQLNFELIEQDTISFAVYDRWALIDTLYFEDSLLNPGLYNFEYSTDGSGIYIAALKINGDYFSKHITKINNSTSIKIKEETESISISPNPAKQYVKIEFPDETVRNIKILNAAGKLVKQIQENKEKSIIVNIEGYAKGVYFISFNNKEKQTTKTLIIK